MELHDKIVKLRKMRLWSQEELAERLDVSRQAISRWENGTALPDAQNILQLSKLFEVTTDYLLNDDYESDKDLPAVQSAQRETEALYIKKKHLHLVAAVCFAVSTFCSLIGVVSSGNNIQLGLSCFMLALCAGNSVAQFVLYFKKR